MATRVEKMKEMQELWNSLPKEDQELLKKAFKQEQEAKSIRKEFDANRLLLEELGYSLWSHSSDWTGANFSKNILAETPAIHVQLYRKSENNWRAEVSHAYRAIKVCTGDFSFPHPDFQRVFESQVEKAAIAIHMQEI